MSIPIIDVFAGPGGLGEGFSAFKSNGNPIFKIKLSIEMDEFAHKTLELRAFYRQFTQGTVPTEYYDYLKKKISRDNLFEKYKSEASFAKKEAWKATLGEEPRNSVKKRITEALNRATNWVLIGGPPCQAYSIVGRSRMRGENPWKYAQDHRHHLYKQYLRILADHQPPVFVMENVKGLLSSSRTKTNKKNTFDLILKDLKRPLKVKSKDTGSSLTYELFSCSTERTDAKLQDKDFVVRSEEYGIPQARHRVIIFGIRSDFYNSDPKVLKKSKDQVFINDVIGDLPRLRSGLSKEIDSPKGWQDAIKSIAKIKWPAYVASNVKEAIVQEAVKIEADLTKGTRFMTSVDPLKRDEKLKYYIDDALDGVCNHESRSHIRKDLHRYFFASVFACVNGRSPTLNDFPKKLLPNHVNIQDIVSNTIFNDRFRVQVYGKPSTTIVSHISKDGHYYIHYDPSQCRSLTVREAARLQTFPDNYFFEGNRTQQYHQVGNAVPPLLAKQIAEIAYNLFKDGKQSRSDVFTKQKRSEVMSRIRGKGNKGTELAMIQILRSRHISGWRRNQTVLGKPDFVFPQHKVALFVDGCFWHGCPKHSNTPRNNRAFWEKKLQGNKDRDKYVSRALRQAQWKVVRVWEHELSNSDHVVKRILAALQPR